jgi:hypothetical protein
MASVTATVDDRLMGAMMKFGINEEGARTFDTRRIDRVGANRAVDPAAFGPRVKPALKDWHLVQVMWQRASDGEPVVGNSANGLNEQLSGLAQRKPPSGYSRRLGEPRELVQSARLDWNGKLRAAACQECCGGSGDFIRVRRKRLLAILGSRELHDDRSLGVDHCEQGVIVTLNEDRRIYQYPGLLDE